MSEFEAAGLLAREVYALGLAPLVNLCAGAQRLQTRRHPLPTAARLGDRAILVLSARRDGPVLSVSRMVSFTPISAEDQKRYGDLLNVEAGGLDAAERGGTLGEVFEAMRSGCTARWAYLTRSSATTRAAWPATGPVRPAPNRAARW